MQVPLSFILFLALCPQFSLCDLECNLNSNVKSEELKIADAAASGLTINSKRNLTNLLVLDCTCDDDSKVTYLPYTRHYNPLLIINRGFF